MKAMKGKMMKKLKSVKSIGYLNPDRILQQVNALDDFVVDNFDFKISKFVDNFPFKTHLKSHVSPSPQSNSKQKQQNQNHPPKVDADQLMEDFVDDDCDGGDDREIGSITHICDDKENIVPCVNLVENSSFCSVKEVEKVVVDESEEVTSFNPPDMDSWTLFDPKLVAAFKKAVSEQMRRSRDSEEKQGVACVKKRHKYPFFLPEEGGQPDQLGESEDQTDPLLEFEERCPPGGRDSVVFYTTSLRGIRKTFEDCQSIRFLLESFGVVYCERDVSVHLEYREELWKVMGEKELPPRLFIRGRYIGGADRVSTLHEQGRLRVLFRDIPIDFRQGGCNVCSGLRFILCYTCNGSRKVFEQDGGDQGCPNRIAGVWNQCLQCNENGLVVCPLC